MQLFVLGSAEVSFQAEGHHLATLLQHLHCLVVGVALQGLAVHFDDPVVDLDTTTDVGGTARGDALDKDAGELFFFTDVAERGEGGRM